MKRLLAFAALAPLALAGMSGAQSNTTLSAALQPNVLAAVEAGQPTRFEYELKASAWVLFIPVTAKASFDITMRPENYTMRSKVKTTGLADILVNYDMDLAASGYTDLDGLRTYAYVSQNHDGKKDRRVDLKYLPNAFEMTATPRFGNLGDPAATTAQVLDASDPITALISFMMEPRAPGADPCGGPIKTFDGRQLTHLHLTNKGTKNVRSSAWKGEAIECHIRMEKVAGYKKGENNKDTLTGIEGPIRVWLAPLDNGAHVPVRMEVQSDDIGKVTLQASKMKFTPLED